MANIGGNISVVIQKKAANGKNAIGEAILQWSDTITQTGWLGMQSGDSKRNIYNAKIEESTHVFLCDYNAELYALKNEDTRLIYNGDMYDVQLIDNPDEMNEQLEIYLRKVGGGNG